MTLEMYISDSGSLGHHLWSLETICQVIVLKDNFKVGIFILNLCFKKRSLYPLIFPKRNETSSDAEATYI